MQIKFNPQEYEKGSGLTSSIAWENPYLLSALNTAFAVGSNERIASLEITPDGITARFESLPTQTEGRKPARLGHRVTHLKNETNT